MDLFRKQGEDPRGLFPEKFTAGDRPGHGTRKVLCDSYFGENPVHHESPDSRGRVLPDLSPGAEEIGRLRTVPEPSTGAGSFRIEREGRIAERNPPRDGRLFLPYGAIEPGPFQKAERAGLIFFPDHPGVPADGKAIKDMGQIGIGNLRRLFGQGVPDGLGRSLRDDLQAVFRPGHGDIENIEVVDELQLPFPAVVFRKEGILASGAEIDRIDSVRGAGQAGPRRLRTAPAFGSPEKFHLLGIGEDYVRELQALGLMDRHHADGRALLGGRKLRILPFPVFEECGKMVPVRRAPVLEKVHKGVDISGFPFHGRGVGTDQVPQEGFRQIRQGMVGFGDMDPERPGQIPPDRALVPGERRLDEGQFRHQAADYHGGLDEEGIVRDDRQAVGDQFRSDPRTVGIGADEDGDIAGAGAF